MIEKCARAKLLETQTSSKWTRDVMINEKFPNSKQKSEYTSSSSNGNIFGYISVFIVILCITKILYN